MCYVWSLVSPIHTVALQKREKQKYSKEGAAHLQTQA